jgi:hypothetical protein
MIYAVFRVKGISRMQDAEAPTKMGLSTISKELSNGFVYEASVLIMK